MWHKPDELYWFEKVVVFLTIKLLIESISLCCCTVDWVHFRWAQRFRKQSAVVEAAVKEEKDDYEIAVGNTADDDVEEAQTTTSNNPEACWRGLLPVEQVGTHDSFCAAKIHTGAPEKGTYGNWKRNPKQPPECQRSGKSPSRPFHLSQQSNALASPDQGRCGSKVPKKNRVFLCRTR